MITDTIVVIVTLCLRSSLINASFKFVPEDPELAFPCENMPDSNGLWDFFDLSQTTFSYEDDAIHASGHVGVNWDVESTDRIVVQAEVLRYSRNAWHRTPLSLVIDDFCKGMFEPNNYVYEVFGQYIIEEDRKCPAKGLLYHFEDFAARADYIGPMKWTGPHKLVLKFKAFDKDNKMREKTVCAEVPGEMVII